MMTAMRVMRMAKMMMKVGMGMRTTTEMRMRVARVPMGGIVIVKVGKVKRIVLMILVTRTTMRMGVMANVTVKKVTMTMRKIVRALRKMMMTMVRRKEVVRKEMRMIIMMRKGRMKIVMAMEGATTLRVMEMKMMIVMMVMMTFVVKT